jgi:deoxyribonucleoside regulator
MHSFSTDQLHLAARYYYEEGLGQAEVAKRVNISQTKVSRLLALARERGIVRISVAPYDPRNKILEKQITDRLGLKSAYVIKVLPNLPIKLKRETLAHFAAPIVASILSDSSTIAIAGGRTICEVVSELQLSNEKKLKIVQAMGNIDSQSSPVDAAEIGQTLARKSNGTFFTLNSPAFVPTQEIRSNFLSLEPIKAVSKILGQSHIALVGLGTLENSVFVERGVFSSEDIDMLKQVGAVGEICGRFFDSNGSECNTTLKKRIISVELKQLQRIPEVVAIVTGSDRGDAIKAAIRGKLIKSLIIDEAGAASLFNNISPCQDN